MDLDHEPPPPAKRKQGRTISFTELQSLSYAIEHFPPSTPKRCHLIADYVRLKSGPRDSLLLEINSPEEKRFEACHNDCQLIVSWLQNAIPAVTDFQSPFYSGFCDTTAFLLPVSQRCGRNLLIKTGHLIPECTPLKAQKLQQYLQESVAMKLIAKVVTITVL